MDRLLTAMGIFIEYPHLEGLIGLAVRAFGRRARRRTVVAVGGLGLLYALYETGMQQRWLCSGECNIRIDLLAIYPALLVSLVVAGVSFLRRPQGPTPAD